MGAQEDQENLLSIAKRAFGDATDQIDDFVKSGMESLGYKPRTEWDDPEPDPQQQQSERRGPSFGQRTGQQQQQQQPRQRSVGGGGREYGG